mmetsp:Transcript_42986/g.82421  ORF Transcript_42986/g.82421 Transcript_42986/m.82421 type:complete len:202 (+) Transcript_42986:725-1330(+)
MLALGDHVLDREGTTVEVEWVCAHQHSKETIIVLETLTTRLHVTNSHRVVKMSVHGEEDVRAEDVKTGDWIVVGKSLEQVSVQSRVIETSTVELRFRNDASVEAWFISDYGILTKGQAIDDFHKVAIQCKHEDEGEDEGEDEEEDEKEEVPSEKHEEIRGSMHPSTSVPERCGRRNRRSRRRYDNVRREIRRVRSPSQEFT